MYAIKNFFDMIYSNESSFSGTLYYDETNNFRKFYLRDNGWKCIFCFGWNCCSEMAEG